VKPLKVTLLGADAVVLAPNHIAHLIEQFWFVHGGQARYHCSHGDDSGFVRPKLKLD